MKRKRVNKKSSLRQIRKQVNFLHFQKRQIGVKHASEQCVSLDAKLRSKASLTLVKLTSSTLACVLHRKLSRVSCFQDF